MESGGQYFFVSDVHLGSKFDPSGERERDFVAFLKSLPSDTKALYLLGDIFDFWVEYRDVIPKGFVRVFSEFARLSDSGVDIYFFKGNHDYWVNDYFQNELGIKVIDASYTILELNGLKICMGHGDGLGQQTLKNRFIFSLFRNRVCISLLKALHPYFIFNFAKCWSHNSRKQNLRHPYAFKGEEDPLYTFANELGVKEHIDYYIFGHLHNSAEIAVKSGGKMFLLDDWGNGANYLNLSGIMMVGRSFPKIDQ